MRYEGLGKVFRCAAIRSAVVRRIGCNRERNRVTPSFAAAHMTAVIHVYDAAGNVLETHEHIGDFKDF
jgi:hypothetical protein